MILEKVESDILTLRKVLPADLDAIGEYRAEFLEHGDSMDGCSNLRRFEDMSQWYDWIRKAERPETCPPNWVPDTQFVGVRRSDRRIVGMLDIRQKLNEACLNFYGNIGYSVRASERRKGYATGQLRLAKEICRSMGLTRILISCHRENTASARTILHNGGLLENEIVDPRNGEVLQRYWIDLSESFS